MAARSPWDHGLSHRRASDRRAFALSCAAGDAGHRRPTRYAFGVVRSGELASGGLAASTTGDAGAVSLATQKYHHDLSRDMAEPNTHTPRQFGGAQLGGAD